MSKRIQFEHVIAKIAEQMINVIGNSPWLMLRR